MLNIVEKKLERFRRTLPVSNDPIAPERLKPLEPAHSQLREPFYLIAYMEHLEKTVAHMKTQTITSPNGTMTNAIGSSIPSVQANKEDLAQAWEDFAQLLKKNGVSVASLPEKLDLAAKVSVINVEKVKLELQDKYDEKRSSREDQSIDTSTREENREAARSGVNVSIDDKLDKKDPQEGRNIDTSTGTDNGETTHPGVSLDTVLQDNKEQIDSLNPEATKSEEAGSRIVSDKILEYNDRVNVLTNGYVRLNGHFGSNANVSSNQKIRKIVTPTGSFGLTKVRNLLTREIASSEMGFRSLAGGCSARELT